MEMNLISAIGIIIVIGFLGGLVTEKLRVPSVLQVESRLGYKVFL